MAPTQEEVVDARRGPATLLRDLVPCRKSLGRVTEGMGRVPTAPGTSSHRAMGQLGLWGTQSWTQAGET